MSQLLRAVLVGQHPSGKNQIGISAVAAGKIHRYPQARFEAWRATAYAQLDRQRGAWEKLRTPGHVVVRYTKGDLITRDVPGMEDALCHVLAWCPVHFNRSKEMKRECRDRCRLPFVLDDGLLDWFEWKPRPLDREHPRLELTVRPYAPEELTP